MSDGVGGSRFVYAYARRAEWWEGLPSRCRGNPAPLQPALAQPSTGAADNLHAKRRCWSIGQVRGQSLIWLKHAAK